MCIRNRLVSLIYRSVILTALIAVYAGVWLTSPSSSETFFTFSVETSLLVLIAMAFNVYFSAKDLSSTGRIGVTGSICLPLSLAILSYSVLGSISFYVGESYVDLYYLPWRVAMNVIFPLSYLLDYLLFQEKGPVLLTHPCYFVLYPFFYIAVMMVKPFITGYDSLNSCRLLSPNNYVMEQNFLSGNGGYNGVVISALFALLLYLIIAYAVVLLDQLLGQRFRIKDRDSY